MSRWIPVATITPARHGLIPRIARRITLCPAHLFRRRGMISIIRKDGRTTPSVTINLTLSVITQIHQFIDLIVPEFPDKLFPFFLCWIIFLELINRLIFFEQAFMRRRNPQLWPRTSLEIVDLFLSSARAISVKLFLALSICSIF